MAATLVSEIQHNDRVWGKDGWYTHECNHNGRIRMATHSIHYHHPHNTCCAMHGGLCDKVTP